MKKLCALMLVLALALSVAPAIAGEKEQLEAQLILKQTQIRAVNAEFRLAQELIKNLQAEAAVTNQEIAYIRIQLRTIDVTEEQEKKIEQEDK